MQDNSYEMREIYIGGNKIGGGKGGELEKSRGVETRVWCNYYQAAILGPGTIGQPRPR